MKHVNTFGKGLNQDVSRSKYDQANYYNASNIRVVTEDGLSTGSIENETGTRLEFTLPNLPQELDVRYPDDTTEFGGIPAVSNLQIIGWTTLNEWIVVFSVDASGTVGQIWTFKYDEVLGTILGLQAGFLDPASHLMYNHKLNFSKEHRIEAIGRFENISTGRVYWTDFYNTLRSLNVLPQFDSTLNAWRPPVLTRKVTGILPNPGSFVETLAPGDIDIKADVDMAMPRLKSIGLGSLSSGGKVGVAYRLTSKQGSVSPYSPTSNLVTLTEVNPNTVLSHEYEGAPSLKANNASVTFNVKGLDTSYDLIELIGIIYTDKDAPTVFKFGEDSVPKSGELDITLTGSETRVEITLTDFAALTTGFDKCKTISVKDNILFAGNIKTTPAVLSKKFDARAYRFKDTRRSLIKDSTDPSKNITIVGPTKTIVPAPTNPEFPLPIPADSWLQIPEDHDAINPYNVEDPDQNPSWIGEQYKYQSDGTTLGGEGPNIKYTFVVEELAGDTGTATELSNRDRFPFISLKRGTGPAAYQTGELDIKGNPVTVNFSSEYYNFTSPLVEHYLTGYARGEVYRFGIEFVTKKGSPIFVEWIGDIKFPDASESVGGTYPYRVAGKTGTAYPDLEGAIPLRTIGIKFTVDISSIRSEISSYRIVRAERGEKDRSRLGTGTFFCFDRNVDDSKFGFFSVINNSLFEVGFNRYNLALSKRTVKVQEIKLNGDEVGEVDDIPKLFTLNDMPGFNLTDHGGGDDYGVHLRYPSTKGVISYMSPLNYLRKTNNYTPSAGDYLKTIGYYVTPCFIWTSPDPPKDLANYRDRQGFVYSCRLYEPPAYALPTKGYQSFKVNKFVLFENFTGTQLLTGANVPEPHVGGDNKTLNTCYNIGQVGIFSEDDDSPLSVGLDTFLIELDKDNPGNHDLPSDMGWNNPGRVRVNTVELKCTTWPGTTTQTLNFISGDSLISPVLDCFRFKEVSYVRPILKQYTGSKHEDRSKQQYMSTGHYQPIDKGTVVGSSLQFNVFGGDSYVNLFDKEFLSAYVNKDIQNPSEILDGPVNSESMQAAYIMPAESFMNTNLCYGKHFNGPEGRVDKDLRNYLEETRTHNLVYEQQNNVEGKFFAKDFAIDFNEAFPHRIIASKTKTDGEQADSWRDFKDANYIDVEGTMGPINKLINFNDMLLFYQDRAFGYASVNEKDLITGLSGEQISLGTGALLDDYKYFSNQTGSSHQFSIVKTHDSIYHYDVLQNKFFKFGAQGAVPLSDLKGLSSFFHNTVKGAIKVTDTTVNNPSPIGIHGVYDPRYSRLLYTFQQGILGDGDFTIGFNELITSFESFYSFKPMLYLNADGKLLATAASAPGKVYLHGAGAKGQFYDSPVEPSFITLVISPEANLPKVFNNLEYNSEISVKDINDDYTINLPNAAAGFPNQETVTSLRYFNDYQDSGVIPLVVNTDVKRRMRHWRHTLIRDQSPNSPNQAARFRDYSLFLVILFDNNNDKRLVLHDMIMSYMPARD